MEGMTKEQFIRKYIDTHKGIHCLSDLKNGAYNKGSLIRSSAGDKNISDNYDIKGKSLIEAKAFEDRAEDYKHYLMDANACRADEILDEEKMPIDKLINAIIKTLPQKVEQKTMNFTFADMVKQAAMDREKVVDVKAKVDDV